MSECTQANELQALKRKFEFSHASKHSFHSGLTSPLSRQKNNKTGRSKPLDLCGQAVLFFIFSYSRCEDNCYIWDIGLLKNLKAIFCQL